jgi:serine/threonine protein phosphatase 1
MGTTYAIGDLHGRIDVLEAGLARIEEHGRKAGDETGANATIVFLGDYIDRGKNSKKVIERLMAGPSNDARWVTLMGNHEEMALMAHAVPASYWTWWTENGGLATSMNYPNRKMSEEHLRWMQRLPDRYQDRHRLFVHAGVKKDVPVNLQTTEMLIWVRHPRNEEIPVMGQPDLYVVHGHTPWTDGPVVLETRCNLDVRAYATGMAPIAVFDDDTPGKPVEMLHVRLGYTPTW